MLALSGLVYPFFIGLIVTFGVSFLIVLTRRWHGVLSLDHRTGVQKVHHTSTPRIGGLAVFAGYGAAAIMSPQPVRSLFLAVIASALWIFLAGVIEDVSKKGRVLLRFVVAIFSGVAFCVLTGYAVRYVEIPFVDDALALPFVAIAFTAFAIAGVINAINIIDGFNGLAAGVTIILLAAFTIVSLRAGDPDMALFCLISIGVALGFLLMNFPFGHVFLGDGGAYFLGFVLASIAIMVPMRNPDVSPWVSLATLAYPVLETLYAIARRARSGRKIYKPDGKHLHMLVYRLIERSITDRTGNVRLANAAVSVLLWGFPVTSLVLVALIPYSRSWSLFALAFVSLVYMLLYRKSESRRLGVFWDDRATRASQRTVGAALVDESSDVPG